MKQPVIFAVASLSVLALTATSSALNVECVHSDLLALDDVGVQVLMPRAASDLVGRRTALVSPQQLEMLLKQPGVKVDGNTVQRIDGDGSQWTGPFVWQKYELVNVPLPPNKLLVVREWSRFFEGDPCDIILDVYDMETERVESLADSNSQECMGSALDWYMYTDRYCQSLPHQDYAVSAPFYTPSAELSGETGQPNSGAGLRIQCKEIYSSGENDVKNDPDSPVGPQRRIAPIRRPRKLNQSVMEPLINFADSIRPLKNIMQSFRGHLTNRRLARQSRPIQRCWTTSGLAVRLNAKLGMKKSCDELLRFSSISMQDIFGGKHSSKDPTWAVEDTSVDWQACSPLASGGVTTISNETRLQLGTRNNNNKWSFALTNASPNLTDYASRAQLLYISDASVCRSQSPAFLEQVEFLAGDDASMCSLTVKGECGCYTGEDGITFVRCDKAFASGFEHAREPQAKHPWCDVLPQIVQRL